MNRVSCLPHSRRRFRNVFNLSFLALSIAVGQYASAEDRYEFESSFLQGGVKLSELEKFSRGNIVAPGVYLLQVVMNDTSIGRTEIEFRAIPDKESAQPCLTAKVLDRAGVDLQKLHGVASGGQTACIDLTTAIEFAAVYYDDAEQRLNVSVPQAYVRRSVQGYVDPSQWDDGVTAGILNYSYSSFDSNVQEGGTQHYLGLTAGLNVGEWRLRSISSYDWNEDDNHWQNRQLYAQRDLQRLSSQLTLGDSSTNGSLFDSFTFRGLQLASDDRMLPDSLSGYAPVVRGQANSNAKVTISQNGYTVYETNVTPGPFEIKDLLPSGYGGDLNVKVTEANGEIREFLVPYSSVVRLLRPGAYRYSMAIGQYRDGFETRSDQPVGQVTYEHGLNNTYTAYTGLQATDNYYAPMVGTAMNTAIGAFGFDVTHATTYLPSVTSGGRATRTGQSARVSFSKTLPKTGSTVSIAAYRYSTKGFYNLSDAVLAMNEDRHLSRKTDRLESNGFFYRDLKTREAQLMRQRSSMQITLNQSLGSKGSVFMTGIHRNYWGHSKPSVQYQVGYNGAFRNVSYSVSAMRSTDQTGRSDDQIYASISVPIGGRTNASANTRFSDKDTGVRGALNGSAGDNNQYTWGTSATGKSGSVYGSYRGSSGILNAAFGSGEDYHQTSLGINGSVVAHPGGITLGQPVSDTFAVIEAPGAKGAAITSQNGVKVDGRGYAVVPYLSPYRRNRVDIDPKGTASSVELKSTSQELIPTAGAVLMKKFETVSGRAAIIEMQFPSGLTVPFGTEVKTDLGANVGHVGQGGKLMARGLADKGVLIIKWGEPSEQQCQINYSLSTENTRTEQTRFEYFIAPCLPLQDAPFVTAK